MTVNHLYPTTRPTLDLNFARQKRLDPRVTFTRGSTATYVGSDGLIKTAASNEARFDHDPVTGESLGLLVEESRTNEALNSDLSSGWSGYNASSEIGPDGNTVMELNGGTAGGTGNILCTRNVTAAQSGDYILSFFIKKPSGSIAAFTYLEFRFFAGSTGGGKIHFDWSTNDWSSNAQNNQSSFILPIQNYGNGWYRVAIKTTLDSGDLTGAIRAGISDTDNSGSGTLSLNNKILIWGAQLEQGAFPTSYIPTSGSTVTRSADVASMTGTNFSSWYNQSEGTFAFEFNAPNQSADNAALVWTARSNNSVAKWDFYTGNSGSSAATFDSSSGRACAFLTRATAVSGKYAWAAKVNDFALSQNGNTALTDSSGAMNSTNDIVSLLFTTGTNLELNGTISRFTYYPTRLTDSQLQELTR